MDCMGDENNFVLREMESTDDDQVILRDPIPDIEELEFKLERKRVMVRALWMVTIFLLILTWIVT